MDFIQNLKSRIRSTGRKVVLPEGCDVRIIQAARILHDEEIAKIILLGEPADITQVAKENNVSLHGFEMINPATTDASNRYAACYVENRPRTKINIAFRLVKKPLNYGAMMVKTREADLMVAGATHATKKVIEAASSCIGLSGGSREPSSFFVMSFVDRAPLIFADCAVNIHPTAEVLAGIAIDTARNAQALLDVPAKVALLSFSTKGSGTDPSIEKLKQALEIVRDEAPDIDIDGELQVDSALIESIAAKKLGGASPVAGQANVLIFPDLNAANIGYKLVKHLAKAQAIGPILQGFSLPVADLSRGASVDEIVATTVVALAMR